MARRAAIDLGSNSVLLTVVDDGRVLHDEARVVGLGRGLVVGGPFTGAAMERALAALVDYARIAGDLGVQPAQVVCGATSASRRAINAASFYATVEASTGLRFRILSGEEEAEATFLGAASAVQGRVAVVDLGGGSTEVAIGDGALEWARSFPLGSVRLTEAVLGEAIRVARPEDLDRMEAMAAFDGVPEQVPAVGVAGSVTTLACWRLGLDRWDPDAVEGAVLADDDLARVQQALLGRDADERRALFAVGADRADTLLAGATILRQALVALGQDQLTVSVRGLRFGLLA